MAANKSSRYFGFFFLIIISQWLVSFGHQQDESVSKQPWGPWMGNRPQPIPVQRPYPDRNGGGGHGGGGVRISGGGRSGGSEKECICNCNCNCQYSECNIGGSSGAGGGSGGGGGGSGGSGGGGSGGSGGSGSGGGGGGSSSGGGGGWGGRGARGTICLPLPPMNCDGKNCFFENGANVGTGNNTFDVPHFGAGGGRNPNGDSDKSPQGMNATDATHH